MMTLNSIGLSTLLCLPAPDVKALGEGRSVCAIPSLFIRPGQKFLLSPSENLDGTDHLEWCYRSSFQKEAQSALDELEYDLPEIKYWAICEKSIIIESHEKIDALESLSVWKKDWLISKINKNKALFLSILRVYKLSESFDLPGEVEYQEKMGRFLSIPEAYEKIQSKSVLSDHLFEKRKQQLENFEFPAYPDIEALKTSIAHYAQTHSEAKVLDEDLKAFLGWADPQELAKITPPWVKEITTSGNSSDGNLFEKCVRQGFITLGFTNTLKNIKASLDPDATGGAGGIDIYCEKPYSIVGECKASKHESVPNSVSAQLIHLGNTHLGKATFDTSIKIIFAAGKLTDHAEKAAIENQINVMRPETLQRLVELKTAHPGAIDLLELKPCLESAPFGTDADTKVNDFIAKIWQKIEIRSQVIQAVKALKKDGDDLVNASDVRNRFNAFASPEDKFSKPEDTHNLLIELSSPLTGYLGRTKGDSWKADRFYFLRDLVV